MYVGSHSLPEHAVPHRCRASRRASGVARVATGPSSSKKLHLQRSYVIVDREAVPARVRPSSDHLGRARIHSSLLGAPLPTPEHTRSTHTHTHTHPHTQARTHTQHTLASGFFSRPPSRNLAHRRLASLVAEGNSLFATGKQQPPHKTSALCYTTQARRLINPRANTPPVCARLVVRPNHAAKPVAPRRGD